MAKEETIGKLKDILKKFKVKLSSAEALKLVDVKLASEGKLADGSSLWSETDFTQGKAVFTQDADGNAVPAKAGDYTMEDGSTVIVDDSGMIAEVKAKELATEMSVEEILPIVAELGEKLDATTTELETEKTAHEVVKTELAAMKVELSALKTTNAKLLKKAAGEQVNLATQDDDLTEAQKELKRRKKEREIIAAQKN